MSSASRVNEFLEAIKPLHEKKAVVRACRQFQKNLRSGSLKSSSIVVYLASARNKAAKENSQFKEVFKEELKPLENELDTYRAEAVERTKPSRIDKTAEEISDILALAYNDLSSDSYTSITLALVLFTGLRPNELFQYPLPSSQSGAKRSITVEDLHGNKRAIRCIVDAEEVLGAWHKLRELRPEFVHMDSHKLSRKTAQSLRDRLANTYFTKAGQREFEKWRKDPTANKESRPKPIVDTTKQLRDLHNEYYVRIGYEIMEEIVDFDELLDSFNKKDPDIGIGEQLNLL